MSGYEINVSITAVCPCCGEDLPSNSYLTVSKPGNSPLDRDNPYERKDRSVFITPCQKCFASRFRLNNLREALQTARDQGSAAWDDWLKEKVDAALDETKAFP